MKAGSPYRVLCVCLGNICRSPTAEVILRQLAAQAGLNIEVDSAGTSNYHPNKAPDTRSQQHARARGYDLSALRARQITFDDFKSFDLILAMDENNLAELVKLKRHIEKSHNLSANNLAQVALMSEHDPNYPKLPVPDPYYGKNTDFERVIDECESAAQGWINLWQQQRNATNVQEPANA